MEEIYAALGMDGAEFSYKVALLLGAREAYTDKLLRAYAQKASLNKNIKNCRAFFDEEDLYEVLKSSVGG